MLPTISEQGLKERKRSKMTERKVVLLDAARARHAEYERLAGELVKRFNNLVDELDHASFHLAVAGPWKEWSDSQPNGSRVYIDEAMLRDSGDRKVHAVLDVMDAVYAALKVLKDEEE